MSEQVDTENNISAKNSKGPTKAQLRIQASFREAAGVAKVLEEPNLSSVQRMIEIFGADFVNKLVEQALQLYHDAVAKGPAAYQEPNTPVSTGKSQPRTVGGVFFFLIKQHCANLGLDWAGLKIASTLWYQENRKPGRISRNGTEAALNSESSNSASASSNPALPRQAGKTVAETVTATGGTSQEETRLNSITTNSPVPVQDHSSNNKRFETALDNNSTKASSASSSKLAEGKASEKGIGSRGTNEGSKPGRIKATVVGNITGSPKFNPHNQTGLVELQFTVEMSQSLPKGLPYLGASRVVVWCTKKQYEKVVAAETATATLSQTRFLIEGEPVPAVGADLTPFLRLLCTRLTTVELEQVRHNNSRSNSPHSSGDA